MIKIGLCLILLISFLSFSLSAYDTPVFLAALRELQENVLPEDNSYKLHTIDVAWKGVNGASKYICHTTCSGLLDAVFMHSYGIESKDLKNWFGIYHPRSKEYYNTILDQNGFKKILKAQDILPGDILAIRFLSQSPNASDATGHVMVVNARPEAIKGIEPLLADTQQWSVEIIDCSRHPHGKTDSRYVNHITGIGKGTIRIYTDLQGEIVAYAWSLSQDSTLQQANERPIVAGRLTKFL